MSYMDQNIAFAPAGGIQELSFDEIDTVGGSDQGDSTVNGAIAGGTAGYHFMKGAKWGIKLGRFAGPAGIIGGALVGGASAYFMYQVSAH